MCVCVCVCVHLSPSLSLSLVSVYKLRIYMRINKLISHINKTYAYIQGRHK